MKAIKILTILLGIIVTMTSCMIDKKDEKTKSLIVYYSNSGNTEKVAQILKEKTGADIAGIVCEKPYSTDFMAVVGEFQQETNSGTSRAIKPLGADIANYDTIYIGFPVWNGTYASPIKTFLKDYDLKGKTVVVFSTFGSGGNTAFDDTKKALPESTVIGWYGVRADRLGKADKEIEQFLVQIGVKKGEIVNLPDFSEDRAVSAEDKAIFDEACGSYPMPLGTPVSVSSRKLPDATEYAFTSKVNGMGGNETQQVIYVIKGDAEGSVAEFTQVVR